MILEVVLLGLGVVFFRRNELIRPMGPDDKSVIYKCTSPIVLGYKILIVYKAVSSSLSWHSSELSLYDIIMLYTCQCRVSSRYLLE